MCRAKFQIHPYCREKINQCSIPYSIPASSKSDKEGTSPKPQPFPSSIDTPSIQRDIPHHLPKAQEHNSKNTSRKTVCKWAQERQLKGKWGGEEVKYLLGSCLCGSAADYCSPTSTAINCIYIYPWHFLLRHPSKHLFLLFLLKHTSDLPSPFKTFTLSACKPLTLKNILLEARKS